ncbi:hypothetical protein FSARC_14886 [Fusarium sarcochroum]|uniref:Uncharacterized protein n=1 Tax=Fusarium sarcochroum TaxID=1208366 RepID=A0A8H4SQ25_9HYPO|nr:hypothetical protein FSARC_14886 [Fusarium sarcochroum]
MSEPLRQKVHQRYLPELDKLLPKSGVHDLLIGKPEHDTIVDGPCEHEFSQLLGPARADKSTSAGRPAGSCLLIHYVEEMDGLFRRRIVEAMSVIKFSASGPVQLAPLWTCRWHNSRDICFTPWKFVLRYIPAITTAWIPQDYFLFQDPQIVIAILDLVLLTLHLGADVKADLIMDYNATHLLIKLLSSIRYLANVYSSNYELHREVFRNLMTLRAVSQ